MHPFENSDCYSYEVAREMQLLVLRPEDNATDAIQWWDGRGGLIDFTKSKAADWFQQRLQYLKQNYNIDGFKFDAGESSFVPSLAILDGPEKLQPASLCTAYAKTVAQINPGMAEMRSLFMAQRLPLVVRMGDKSSIWDYNNGLKSLIPTLLNLNMVGYSTIMPDMIAGNGYGNLPDKELFIRWLQACIFMPVLQFSYAPWDYDDEVSKLSLLSTLC
jgi:alpha-glucosidase